MPRKPRSIIRDEVRVREAIANSRSLRQALQRLGLVSAGGNYATLHKAIEDFQIDTSHFMGFRWRSGILNEPKPIGFYLRYGSPMTSHLLKKRLIQEGLKERKCEVCSTEVWNEKPVPIELHHIDGDRKNNELNNLQILCPNCHAQTDSYRGKKLNKKYTLVRQRGAA